METQPKAKDLLEAMLGRNFFNSYSQTGDIIILHVHHSKDLYFKVTKSKGIFKGHEVTLQTADGFEKIGYYRNRNFRPSKDCYRIMLRQLL